jgi:RNA polymerase sigma-70 factor, ECF subfamily
MEISDISNELLKRASDGDIAACEEIFKAASGFVYNVAFRIVGGHEDAEEATQEVFIKVFSSLKSFRFQSSFKTWAYRIAVNTALNMRKKNSRDTGRCVQYDESIQTKSTIEMDPVQRNLDKKSNEKLVSNMLNKLNPDQRACMVLREMQGLSYEEIASVLKTNINTVRSRLKRAREILLKTNYAGREELEITEFAGVERS